VKPAEAAHLAPSPCQAAAPCLVQVLNVVGDREPEALTVAEAAALDALSITCAMLRQQVYNNMHAHTLWLAVPCAYC
jgi:hypothetical protein